MAFGRRITSIFRPLRYPLALLLIAGCGSATPQSSSDADPKQSNDTQPQRGASSWMLRSCIATPWQVSTLEQMGAHSPALQIDSKGTLHVTFAKSENAMAELAHLWRPAGSQTWRMEDIDTSPNTGYS